MTTETLERLAYLSERLRCTLDSIEWLDRTNRHSDMMLIAAALERCDAIERIVRDELLLTPPERLQSSTEATA